MPAAIQYREALPADIPALALIRAREWESEEYWRTRISGYLDGSVNPQKALARRVLYVALQADSIVGFIAGHLTRRYECDGELEWIDVIPEYRGKGVSSGLLRRLAAWFKKQEASRICVDVRPENLIARRFYRRHGAGDLNKHWLVWDDIGVVIRQE
jgi:ribosomal protein S18 acetylase RimI-like enzyme